MNYSKLKEVIKSSGFALKEVAISAGISEQGFLAMLKKQSMKVETLEKICLVLKKSPIEFFEADYTKVEESVERYGSHEVLDQFGTNEHLPKKAPTNLFTALTVINSLLTKLEASHKELQLKTELLEMYRKK